MLTTRIQHAVLRSIGKNGTNTGATVQYYLFGQGKIE